MTWTVLSAVTRVNKLRCARRKTAAMKRELWELEMLLFEIAGVA